MKKKIIKTTVAFVLAAVCGVSFSGSAISTDGFAGSNISAWNDSETKTVILGGFPFGVKLMCDGVIIIDISTVSTANGTVSPAKDAGLRLNDIIIDADGKKVRSNEALEEIISDCGESVDLTVCRDGKNFTTRLTPACDARGIKRAGIWVRDSAAGIGTVSYIDPENGSIAGLGHGICDSDTQILLPLEHGEICKATITALTKSTKGNIGGLNGYFDSKAIGTLEINDNYGIYAHSIAETGNNMLTEVADIPDITTGEATVITTIDGNSPKAYSAVIESIDFANKNTTKNMVIRITDPELLEKAGGIVQGMSGSPILQNGKLIGAITHVFVNFPEKGYAIFARNMLENYEAHCRNLSLDAA